MCTAGRNGASCKVTKDGPYCKPDLVMDIDLSILYSPHVVPPIDRSIWQEAMHVDFSSARGTNVPDIIIVESVFS